MGALLPTHLRAVEVSPNPEPFRIFDHSLPYRAHWGSFIVGVEATGEDQRVANRLRIFDEAGRVLKEINASYIEAVDYPSLAGRAGLAQLQVTTAPDNNLVSERATYCFASRGTLHNILAIPGNIDGLRDLDHDGRPELLLNNPAPFEYVGGLCHAAYPPIFLILRWNGKHYHFANQRFPAAVLAQVRKKKKAFRADLQAFHDPRGSLSWDYLVGDAIGIYADLASIGRREAARRWLLARLPSRFVRKQFREILPEVEAHMAKFPLAVTTNQRSIINAPAG